MLVTIATPLTPAVSQSRGHKNIAIGRQEEAANPPAPKPLRSTMWRICKDCTSTLRISPVVALATYSRCDVMKISLRGHGSTSRSALMLVSISCCGF